MPPEASPLHFDSFRELEVWLADRGLRHLRQVAATALEPFMDESQRRSLRYTLSVCTVDELACTEGLRRGSSRWAYAPRLGAELSKVAEAFLAHTEQEATLARDELPERLKAPEEALFQPLHEAVVALRRRHGDSTAPRTVARLRKAGLSWDPEAGALVFEDDLASRVGERFGLRQQSVQLRLTPLSVECTCGLPGCEHALAALDATLLLLGDPARLPFAKTVVEELSLPLWERALREFDRLSVAAEERPYRLSFLLDPVAMGQGVQVVTQHPKKDGEWTVGSRRTPSELLRKYGSSLDHRERDALELLQTPGGGNKGRVLRALVGHPRVYVENLQGQPWRVGIAPLGFIAEERLDHLLVQAAVEDEALHVSERQRIIAALKEDHQPWLLRESQRAILVVEPGREALAMLSALNRVAGQFPKEATGALLDRVAKLQRRAPVKLPSSMLGDPLEPAPRALLRLSLQPDRSLRGELLIRTLPECPAYPPSEGPRELHLRRDGRPFHCRRRLDLEPALAQGFLDQLPLAGAVFDGPTVFVLENLEDSLSLLAFIQEMEAPPELEWKEEQLRVVSRAVTAPLLRVKVDRKRDWFGVSGILKVGSERVELATLLEAARRADSFVRTESSAWVALPEALRLRLLKLSDHVHKTAHGLELGITAAEALDGLVEAGASVSSDATWRTLAEKIFAAKELKPRVPRTLRAELRPYQHDGFAWMTRLASWGAGAVLADDMGLGKTVQALAVLLDRASKGPQLVVAPTSVGFNWVAEAAKFAPSLKLHVFADSDDRGDSLSKLGPKDVLVLSYGLLVRDVDRISKLSFATVVFDEVQALKNAATQRAKAARAVQAEFRVALSGTPLENHLGELWSVFRIAFPGLLGSWEQFRDRFATPIEKRIDPTAAPALARVLEPFLLRRTKAQVAPELPARTEVTVPVVLTSEEFTRYEDARIAAVEDLNTPTQQLRDEQRRFLVLAALTRLRLLASHPRLVDPNAPLESSKLTRLLELLEELRAEGHRTLVFSQFTSHLALVRDAVSARGFTFLELDGSTPRKEREKRVQAFQAGEGELFLLSLKAGGTGLNLTAADHVIHLDPWWNPAVEDQAADRAHRMGQTKPVTIFRLVAKGTLEEQILLMHGEKRALVSSVLEGKDGAARLGTKELLQLLSGGVQQRELPTSTLRH